MKGRFEINKVKSNIFGMGIVNITKRFSAYVLGVFLVSMGVALSIKAGLGVTPLTSFPYVLSLWLSLEVGAVTTGVFVAYVLLQAIILKKDFKNIYWMQLLIASLFGNFLSFSNGMIVDIIPYVYYQRIILLIVGISLMAIGIILYLSANLIMQPPEGLVIAVAKKTGISFCKTKIYFDNISVLMSLAVLLISGIGIVGIREGTIIASLGLGKMISLFSKKLNPLLVMFYK